MTNDIRHYFFGAAICFLGMVGICVLVHPDVFRYYGYGVSEFGTIHDTLIPFFVGFAGTAFFLTLIALSLRPANKFLSTIFLLVAATLCGIAITSYPFNRFTYQLHWCFVILLTLVISTEMARQLRIAAMATTDYVLVVIFFATTIVSILPIVRDIPIFRDFILRELLAFVSSFWFLGRAALRQV